MWIGLWGVGFDDFHSLDEMTLRYNMLTSIVNTAYTMWTSMHHRLSELGQLQVAALVAADARTITDMVSAEKDLANLLYNMLVPGWLFSGFLQGQMIGTLLPLALNLLYLRAIFVWRCFPKWVNNILVLLVPYNPDVEKPLKKRVGELILEPGALSLAWDYSNILVTPAICLLALFFPLEQVDGGGPSPSVWRIFRVMLGWVVFNYLFHRYVRLPLAKKQMHSSHLLDVVARRWWGMPLSMVAAAWAFWGWRLGYFYSWMVPVVFGLSFQVYVMLLMVLGTETSTNKHDYDDVSYKAVERKLLYSWFNTNPVHVLKSKYIEDDIPAITRVSCPFFYGKEDVCKFASEEARDNVNNLS